jgi:hypothetical protein
LPTSYLPGEFGKCGTFGTSLASLGLLVVGQSRRPAMRCPRRCARLPPSAVRVRIRSRSTSAEPPSTANISRPVLVPVSVHGSASERNCAFAFHDALDNACSTFDLFDYIKDRRPIVFERTIVNRINYTLRLFFSNVVVQGIEY